VEPIQWLHTTHWCMQLHAACINPTDGPVQHKQLTLLLLSEVSHVPSHSCRRYSRKLIITR
jgi:hypothetical protein